MRAHENRDRIRIGVWAAAALPIALLAGFLIERSPIPGARPMWSGEGRADQAHAEPSDQRFSLKRSFPSHDFH